MSVRLPPGLQEPGGGLSPPVHAGAGGTSIMLLRGTAGRTARSGLLLGLRESWGVKGDSVGQDDGVMADGRVTLGAYHTDF